MTAPIFRHPATDRWVWLRSAADRHVHAWNGEREFGRPVADCGYDAPLHLITTSPVGRLCPDCVDLAANRHRPIPANAVCTHCITTPLDFWRWLHREHLLTRAAAVALTPILATAIATILLLFA